VDLGPLGPRARYELTKAQEVVIGDLAGKMRFVGIFLIVLATLALVQVIFVALRLRVFDWGGGLNFVIYSLLGFWTLQASGGFTAVVETVGWDVPHLMDALSGLRRMYSLIYWILIMALVAVLVLILASVAR
jgi:hypothetical protein